MKMKYILIAGCLILTNINTYAEKVLKQADWQQEVNYNIDVKLDDVNHILNGNIMLEYHNNSPNDLDTIWFHIYPNAFKNNQTAFAKQQLSGGHTDYYYSPAEDRGSIYDLNFTVDNQTVKWAYHPEHIDICYIVLNKPVVSGGIIEIATPFNVKIPQTFSRLGHLHQEYQITQWFPKPAVYDVNGWHPMPYLDIGEFYYEYGKFDVSITVPQNYMVAATGELQNEDEKKWLDELAAEGYKAKYDSLPKSSSEYKTLRFIQDNVHDFAWFASKRFYVLKDEVILSSGRKVETWLFDPVQRTWLTNPDAELDPIKDAVIDYSAYVGEYPYSHATVVVGPLSAGGGMEYPMITIVSFPGRQVIMHEVGHNWFQGILGSNEREYPWMDEGINNFYESLFNLDSSWIPRWNTWENIGNPTANAGNTYYQFKLGYDLMRGDGLDQPVGIHSTEYTELNYGLMVYGKNTLLFTYLRDYLGPDVFDNCMRTYFDRWKFKHPLPGDILAVFEEVSNKELDWFFDDLITEKATIDYAMQSAAINDSNEWTITVHQVGDAIAAVPIDCYRNNRVVKTYWIEPGKTSITFKDDEYERFSITLKPYFVDYNQQNNSIKASGIFKKVETLNVSFGSSAAFNDPRRTQLRGIPIPAWNEHNHFMVGATFFNTIIPGRKFEYRFTPLYSLSEGDLNGYARFQINDVKSKGLIRKIESGVTAARFQYNDIGLGGASRYTRISPFAVIHFRKSHPRSTVTNTVYEYFHYIEKQNVETENVDLGKPKFLDLSFEHRDDRAINPWSYKVRIHENLDSASGQFRKLTGEFKYRFHYSPRKHNKFINLRVFAGTFLLPMEDNIVSAYAFRAGRNNGTADYNYTRALMDRSAREGMFSQQLIDHEGNLKTSALGALGNESMLAVNLEWGLTNFIRFYGDAMYTSDYEILTANNNGVQYVGGMSFVFADDIFRVNFPFLFSQAFEDYYENNDINGYGQRITFTLNLNALNPFGDVLRFVQ